MSKLLTQLALLQTKVVVNAYTWTTLPLYTIVQKPWRRVRLAKKFNVKITKDGQGRTIYARPITEYSHHPYYQYKTYPESFAKLDRNREVIGVREVIQETLARDDNGEVITIEGKPLKRVQLSDRYKWHTVGEAMQRIDSIARGLREMGVRKGDHVLIYADNGVEWFYSCLALARLNATMVTLFSTLGDTGVVYGINQSDAKYVITSECLLPKIAKLSPQLNHLNTVVYIRNGKIGKDKVKHALDHLTINQHYTVVPFDVVESSGAQQPPCEFPLPSPDDVAVIMYTSGTTGDPKGVIMQHKQLNASIKNLMRMDEEMGYLAFRSQYAAYLPMAHLFGFLANIASFCSDSKLAFCSPMTLLDSSPAHVKGQVGDIKLIRPEFFVAVPLVLERILKEIYRKLNAQSPIAAHLFTYLMDYKIRWTQRGYDTPIINRLVCKKINEQFGGRLKLIGVSSAPLHERTHALVQAALNAKVLNAYGATETCGGSHMLHINDLAYGTCGVPYSTTKFYLKDWTDGGYSTTDYPNPRGEIILGGDTIAAGYYKMDDETRKAFVRDENGEMWYSSGDIGEVLPNGTLKIIDRKKDLTKLANGEFVSLGKIESGLRNSKFVENICVCTDPYSNHVTALISPNRRAIMELAASLGKTSTTSDFATLCDDADVAKHVYKSIKHVCKQNGFKVREIPVWIKLVSEEWTQDNNLLTAAFKLKRKQVHDYYRDDIRQMFAQVDVLKKQQKSKLSSTLVDCKIVTNAAAQQEQQKDEEQQSTKPQPPPPMDQGINVS